MKKVIIGLCLIVIFSTQLYGQRIHETRAKYAYLVEDTTDLWMYESWYNKIQVPPEMSAIIHKINKDVLDGEIEVLDGRRGGKDIISIEEVLERQDEPDTIFNINPITLEEQQQVLNHGLVDSIVHGHELWYFDDEELKLKSKLIQLGVLHTFYFLKNDTGVLQNVKKVTIDNSPMITSAMVYELGKRIQENIHKFEWVDDTGESIRYQEVVAYLDTVQVYGCRAFNRDGTYELFDTKFSYYWFEEEWSIDMDTYYIEKKVVKLTPVFITNNHERIRPFSIVF